MAEFNEQEQKLTIKLVYYGPALSGKTTNLLSLHDNLQAELKGDLMTMETKNDRTLFFDLLPIGFRAPSGLLVKFKLFTVPGQVAHDGTRKAVLSRADGVVFVADSQTNQGTNNAESFQNLAENAARVGLDFETLPLVVQFNKRDLPDIISEEEVRNRWGKTKWPIFFSTAINGEGVESSFSELLRQVYQSMERHFDLKSKHGVEESFFINTIMNASLGDSR
ncbi:MAG: signal recognition particle receptor subunit beta [Enterobacterales bacterium]|jgi:signal recognition particle receptor subunit beta